MRFDVSVAQEARCIRITVRGESELGRMLSLLQVLEIDSRSWHRDAVLLDLSGLQASWSGAEQVRFVEEAARALRRMRKIALLAPAGRVREGCGVRVFASDGAAQQWLAQP